MLMNKYELLNTVKKQLDSIVSIHFVYKYPHQTRTVQKMANMRQ